MSGAGWQRNATRVAGFVASLLSIALFAGFGWGWYEYRSLNAGLHQLQLNALSGGSGDLSHKGSSGSPGPKVHGTEQNLLITGLDSRAGLSPAEQRLLHTGSAASTSTDTIMIVHIPADGKHATLMSIPRDTYVDIPGYLKNKINAAFADATGGDPSKTAAGANLLVQTVEQLTGLSINHFVQVGFGGFYTITKAIGTLPVNLCRSVNDTVAYNVAHGNGRVGSGFVAPAGRQELTPLQAFQFVRQRHGLPHEDLDRERRQQYFLAAAFNHIASAGILLNPIKLDHLINAIHGALYLDTDLAHHLTTLADQMIDLSAGNIKGYTLPTKGGSADVAGVREDVQLVDPAAARQWVDDVINGRLPSAHRTRSTGPTPTASSDPAAPTKQKCIN